MSHIVYAGTFDPITFGHLDLIARAARLFDRVSIAVAIAHHKTTLFDFDTRCAQVATAIGDIGCHNAHVLGFDGLLIDTLKEVGATALLRGVRHGSDLDYEMSLFAINKALLDDFETVYLLPNPKFAGIASGLIKEVAKLGGDVQAFVPPFVAAALQQKYRDI